MITHKNLSDYSNQSNYNLKKVVSSEDNFSNNIEINNFGGKSNVGALSDKLNKQTQLVSQLFVGIDRFSYKFEGKVRQKSGIKYGQGDSKYFYIQASDPNNQEINISFWTDVDQSYDLIEIGQTYYFIGGEVNRYNQKLELKFKKSDYEIIPKESINSKNPIFLHKMSSSESSIKDFTASNTYNKEDSYDSKNYNQGSNKNKFNQKNNYQIKKQILSISEAISSSKQYLSTLGYISVNFNLKINNKDIIQTDKNIKLRIKDNSSDSEIAVMIFPELSNQWKDRFEMNKWYYFYEFVRQSYLGDTQLKNNLHSSIKESEEQKEIILQNPEQVMFKKTLSIKQNDQAISEQKPINLQRYCSSVNQDFSKFSTVEEIIEQAQQSEIGQRKEFIVYGYLVSIQMKNKLYYYRCSCQTKSTLKYQGDSFFCETCQKFINPLVQLMLRAFVQDSTGTLPVMIFDSQSSQLINQINPEIQLHEAGQYVKNCIENGQEEELRQLFSKLDYIRYKFEIQYENKEFNNEQEITYKILKIERENLREESKYLLQKLQTVIKQEETK